MAEKKPVSFGKRILYIAVTLFFLFLIVEAILSIFYYQKRGSSKLATLELARTIRQAFYPKLTPYNPEAQKLVRPDSSDAYNDLVTKETALSNRYEYSPWIEFKNADYKGSWMNIDNRVRKSVPDSYINPAANDTLLIYFFGGSTTFGFNVADFETIPSIFVQQYKERYPNAKSIKVVNFGCPNYYTYQELVLFTNLIFEGHKPDIAVFFDGLNDFWFGQMLYHNQSFYSFYFRKSYFSAQPPSMEELWFKDSLQALFKTPAGISEKDYSDRLMENFFKNIDNIRKAATMTNTKTYFFCQPVPFYKYPNQVNDHVVFRDSNTRFNYIYPILEKKAPSVDNFTFLGDILENEKGHPFVDGFHYGPKVHKNIANRMIDVMQKDLQ